MPGMQGSGFGLGLGCRAFKGFRVWDVGRSKGLEFRVLGAWGVTPHEVRELSCACFQAHGPGHAKLNP